MWIDANDKLPEKDINVITIKNCNPVPSATIEIDSYQTLYVCDDLGVREDCSWFGNDEECNVTHWMPLPVPPNSYDAEL